MSRTSEAQESGRARRREVPRAAHAEWTPSHDRPDVVDFLQHSDRGRVPELLPLRYSRMAASPFAFFRGAAALMARDLATTPRTGWDVQASGDAHVANFGAFATPERALVFDLNDFDETAQGPWEWDLKRLAASVILLARANGVRGSSATDAVLAMMRAYRLAMRDYARTSYLAVFYAQLAESRVLELISSAERTRARQSFRRAEQRDQLGALAKLTAVVDGQLRIVDRPPVVTHVVDDDILVASAELVDSYRQSLRADVQRVLSRYTFVDAARKVVGVGSVGTRCFVVLLMGRNASDPLFLQIKEALPSALAPYVNASPPANHGQRVVEGQHRIQAASDMFLGWGEQNGTHYYVRQLQDMKGRFRLTKLGARTLPTYAGLCGLALARAHARTGDPRCLSDYLGRGDAMDRAIAGFGVAYADQTERDHAAFVAALGRMSPDESESFQAVAPSAGE